MTEYIGFFDKERDYISQFMVTGLSYQLLTATAPND
jgi:hypothetical protein